MRATTDSADSLIPAMSLDSPSDNAMTALYRVALGPVNTDYYLPVFARFDTTGRTTTSWNWAASLATLNWMVFRQVWSGALAYVAVAEGLALLVFALGRQFLNWPQGVELGVLAAFAMLAFAVPGLYGNAILHADIRRRISRALAASRTVPEACALLEQRASSRKRLQAVVGANVALALVAVAAYLSLPSAGFQSSADTSMTPAVTVAQASAAASAASAASAGPAQAVSPPPEAAPAPAPEASAPPTAPVRPSAAPAPAPTPATAPPATTLQQTSPSATPAARAVPAAEKPASDKAAATKPGRGETAERAPSAKPEASASKPAAPASKAESKTASKAESKAASKPAAAPERASRTAPASGNTKAPAAATAAASAASEPASAPLATVGSAAGYYINVGLFADEANARKAQARLLNEGLPAFRQELNNSKGRRIRVRVGPYDSRAQAAAAAESIRAMDLEAVVFKQ